MSKVKKRWSAAVAKNRLSEAMAALADLGTGWKVAATDR